MRVLLFKLLQLTKELVELEVADERLVVHVVLIIVFVYEGSKLGDALSSGFYVDVAEEVHL